VAYSSFGTPRDISESKIALTVSNINLKADAEGFVVEGILNSCARVSRKIKHLLL